MKKLLFVLSFILLLPWIDEYRYISDVNSCGIGTISFSSADEVRNHQMLNTPCLKKIELTGGQGGIFLWDQFSEAKENGIGERKGAGTVIKPNQGNSTGRWIRKYSKTHVNVLWFGNTGENDSALFQAAHDSIVRGNIHAPSVSGGYLFTSTVKISNDHHFIGNQTIIKSKPNMAILNDGKIGFYPTMLFSNEDHRNGNKNILVNGFIFDGDDKNYLIGKAKNKSGVSSLIEFIRVHQLNLDDNHVKNFYSNSWNFKLVKGLTEEEQRGYAAVNIRWCENISIRNFSLTSSRREGLEFWRSKNINLDNFYSSNERLCTPISAWLSENVNLINVFIDESKTSARCSTVNWLVKNSKIINSTILGGRGIDIGNEITKPFVSENNYIENNFITGGIYIIGRDKLHTRNLVIKNNKFISTAAENKYVIQLASVNGAIIKGNLIDVKSYKAGIYLQGNDLYPMMISNIFIRRNTIVNGETGIKIRVGGKLNNINILENLIDGDTAIYFDIRDDGVLENSYINGNFLKSNGKFNNSSLRNVGIGFRYNANLNRKDHGEIKKIEIKENIINSPNGLCVLFHKKGTDRKVFKKITKINNTCSNDP